MYVVSYLALHLLVPYTMYDRYLIPLIPFLLLFFITELGALLSLTVRELALPGQVARKSGVVFIGLILFVMVSAPLYYYVSNANLLISSAPAKEVIRPPLEDAQTIEWINAHTDPSDVLICSRDPMYYLYTGRKAIRSYPTNMADMASFQNRESDVDEQAKSLLKIITENKGRYLIVTTSDLEKLPAIYRKSFNALLEQHQREFLPVFESTNERSSTIYRIEKSAE